MSEGGNVGKFSFVNHGSWGMRAGRGGSMWALVCDATVLQQLCLSPLQMPEGSLPTPGALEHFKKLQRVTG